MATHSQVWTAILSNAATSVTVGQAVVMNTSGDYVVATTANRSSFGRSVGIARTAADVSSNGARAFEVQQGGYMPTALSGLGAGSASWVRVSSAGALERVTPGSGDDLVGKCNARGDLFIEPGVWDSTNYTSTAAAAPTGTGFPHITSGSQDAAAKLVENADVHASAAIAISKLAAIAASDIASGTLLHERGGLEADVSAYSGLVKITGGATSAVAAPSGAVVGTSDSQTLTNKGIDADANTITNIENADIKAAAAIAVTKLAIGSAFQYIRTNSGATANEFASMASTIATFLATPSGANLASALTTALTTGKGGTGVTSLTAFAEAIATSKEISASFFSVTSIDNSGTGNLDNVTNTDAGIIRFTGAAPVVRGLAAPAGAKLLILMAVGGALTLNDQDAGSTASNRFDLNTAAAGFYQKSFAVVVYDTTTARWREAGALARA